MPVALIAALLAAAAPHARPAARPALVVVVQQETTEPFDAAALRAIDREVARVWQPYADVAVRDESAALSVAADDVLTLVVTDRLADDSGDGLGWIAFVDGRPSHTIYVSRGRATMLAAQGRWAGRQIADWPAKVRETFLLRAVATAIAHEVGHFLLRSKVHASTGLMRAHFTVGDLMNASARTYQLEPAEETVLQQRLRGYLLARDHAADVALP